VVVSHDRAFLDRTVSRIVELEAGTQRVHEFAGGWNAYEAAREHARREHERAYGRWDAERQRFRDLHHTRATRHAHTARVRAGVGRMP